MPYITTQHLIERFGMDELVQISTPDDPTAVAVNAVRVDAAVADVDALIDAKLAYRYALPLVNVPRVLANIACDLVRARLYEDRITERVGDRERAALKLLDEIAKGAVSLGLDAQAQAVAPPTGGPQFNGGARVFTPGTLADYAP